jgi:hypothetical protein
VLSTEFIKARTNIEILARERGKIVDRRETHNIVVALGQAWLAGLVCGSRTDYAAYMGAGIGGSRQNNPLVDAAPLTTYPSVGARSQTDTDMGVTAIERPVCISSASAPVTPGDDVWLKAVAAPTASNKTRFVCVFSELDLSFGTFTVVPLSELGLFTTSANPLVSSNTLVAYDTFAPISKTTALELEVRWTFIF